MERADAVGNVGVDGATTTVRKPEATRITGFVVVVVVVNVVVVHGTRCWLGTKALEHASDREKTSRLFRNILGVLF